MIEQVTTHQVFRALLWAMAEPGTTRSLPRHLDPSAALAALLDCAWDNPTEIVVSGESPFDDRSEPEDANLVVVKGPCSNGAVLRAPRGTEEFPESGATIVYDLTTEASSTAVMLTGPGIDGSRSAVIGLAPSELRQRGEACVAWPTGIDTVLLLPGPSLMALPRTTRVEVLG